MIWVNLYMLIIQKKNILILGKVSTQGLDDTTLAEEKGYAINFSKQHKNFCLSLHWNGVNSYIFATGVEINKFKVKDSEENAVALCLSNVSIDFSVDNLEKTGLYEWMRL